MEDDANDASVLGGHAKALPEIIDDTPHYSIGDVSDITGISIHTLRYYDKCGFFPYLARGGKRGDRSFSEVDIAQLRLVDALRRSGLSIEGLQYFVRLQVSSSSTEEQLRKILEDQKSVLEIQAEQISTSLKILDQAIAAVKVGDSSIRKESQFQEGIR